MPDKSSLEPSTDFLILPFTVASWRVKETERMIAICTELRKVSIQEHLYASKNI